MLYLSATARFVAAIVIFFFSYISVSSAQDYNCLPTCDEDDAKLFAVVAGSSIFSLGNEPLGFFLTSTGGPTVEFSIFDADADGDSRWDIDANVSTGDQRVSYRMYADPDQTGDISGLLLIHEVFSDNAGIVDNAWFDVSFAQSAAALKNGQYHYLVVVTQELALSGVADGLNSFKIRSFSGLSIAGDQTVGFYGSISNAIDIVVPGFPSVPTPTTHDGEWEFELLVTVEPGGSLNEFVLWDGDLDFGQSDGAKLDTDDPDTPNTIPVFNTSPDALAEGVTPGFLGQLGVGNPPDNVNEVPALVRGDAVTIVITDPVGNMYMNANPSGNLEWEKFEIRTTDHPQGCDSSLADYCVARLSAGIWNVRMTGMDLANVNFYRSEYAAVAGPNFGGVGNYVWIDENSDGLQDAGEPGISGVTVQLLDAGGSTVGEAITDTNGGYFIRVGIPGEYTVQVDEATLPDGLVQTPLANQGADFGNQSNPYTVQLGVGEVNLTADFGYNWGNPPGNTGLGAIGDRVWLDSDGDGIQDLGEGGVGEMGLGGIEVAIYTDTDGDGIIDPALDQTYAAAIDHNGDTGTGITVTDADGFYIFHGLEPGAYVILVNEATLPANLVQTGDPDQFSGGVVVFDHMTTYPLVLEPGDVYLNADFGYQPPVGVRNTIGDTVFLDLNANGLEDAGEPGIASVSVQLLNAEGESVASLFTDHDGQYLFDGLPDGTYSVLITDSNGNLAGLSQSADPDGMLDGSSTTSVAGGQSDLVQDFGYVPVDHMMGDGLIGDTVFMDRNQDNAFDVGEGMQGVTVNLFDPTGTVLLDTTVTDSNGFYYFGGLDPAGSYVVRVDTGTLMGQLTNTVDPDDPLGSGDSQSFIDLSADPDGSNDGINLDQDFGYVANIQGTIGDLVWLDTNADGNNDGLAGPDGIPGNADDEPGIAGITLDLYLDENGDGLLQPGESRLGMTVTDSNGLYEFVGLPGGNYIIDVSDEANLLHGYWHSLGVADTNDESQSDPYAVNLLAGGSVNHADFGYYINLASVGNFVWFDINQNGIQEVGEIGIPNVEINLTIDYPDGSQIVLTQFTDDNGFYQFNNLLADEDYNGDGSDGSAEPVLVLTVVQDSTMQPSPIDVTDDAIDSDNPDGELADLILGQNDDSNDFGFNLTGDNSISGNVSEDTNQDGMGDVPLSGVTIELFEDANGDGIPDSPIPLDTMLTDPDGNYLFEGLPTGGYVVVQTNLPDYMDVVDGDTTDGGDDVPPVNDPLDDLIYVALVLDPITLTGEDDTGNDFVDEQEPANPAIDVRKRKEGPDSRTFNPGDTVRFWIAVRNIGDVDLVNVVISDPLLPECDRTIGDLAVGENRGYRCVTSISPTATADDGYTNIVIATGEDSSGQVVTDEDPSTVVIVVPPDPAIDIRKQEEGPDSRTFNPGDTVEFEIAVTNTGDVDLINVVVSDPLVPSCDSAIGDLAVGATVIYSCTTTIDPAATAADGFTNIAVVTGEGGGQTVTDEDPSEVVIEELMVCEICVYGQSQITLKVSNWISYRDQNEIIRVREGGLGGTILFEGQVPNGGSFTFDVNNPGTTIVVTVRGNNHPSEYVKASFITDCNLSINQTGGTSYITFQVTDLVGDGEDGDCEPPPQSCELHQWSYSGQGVPGDLYVYDNPYNGDTEYFRLIASDGRYSYFPINKTSNSDWEYLGTDLNAIDCGDNGGGQATITTIRGFYGNCLDNLGNNGVSSIYKRSCTGGSHQQWELKLNGSYYEIINSRSQLCLDVTNGSASNNVSVKQYPCHQGNNQLWELVPYNTGIGYLIKSKLGTCLQLFGSGTAHQYACNVQQAGQHWTLQ